MCNFNSKVQEILDYKPPRRKKITHFSGNKLSRVCPDCGYTAYGFHGIYKSCSHCYLHNSYENKVVYLKRLHKRGALDENDITLCGLVADVYEYVKERKARYE